VEIRKEAGYCGGNGGVDSMAEGVDSKKGGSAAPNTGGGGGGGVCNGSLGSGGSGVVIIRYQTGTATGTGGVVTTSGSYTIHTFTGSGTFTISAPTSVDYLIVGGGGNGAAGGCPPTEADDPTFGGGGGGGEVQSRTGQAFSAGSYPVAVGGTHAPSSFNGITSHRGSNGSNSVGGNSGSGYLGSVQIAWNLGGGGGGSSGPAPGAFNNGKPNGGPGTWSSINGYNTEYGGGGGGAGSGENSHGIGFPSLVKYHDEFQQDPALVDESTGHWNGPVDNRCSGSSCQKFSPPTFYPWTPTEPGTYTITCDNIAEGSSSCGGGLNCNQRVTACGGPNASRTLTVVDTSATPPPAPTPTPRPTPGPGSGYYFDLKGPEPSGYPGIPAYAASTNLNTTNVSETGWLAHSGYNATKIYNSAYFYSSVPADISVTNGTLKEMGSTADFSSLPTPIYGYYWFEYDPSLHSGNPLTINAVNLGVKKIILLVKEGDVNITGNITLTDGTGFLLVVTSGDIIVDPSVGGGGSANLEGIFVADGQFQTGTKGLSPPADTQLWVRGTVAAYGGISLQRDLGLLNSTTPAEFFEFAPDLALLFPRTLGVRSMHWQEVAP
jgi:hypothetical protein